MTGKRYASAARYECNNITIDSVTNAAEMGRQSLRPLAERELNSPGWDAILCANMVMGAPLKVEGFKMNVSIGKRWEEFVEKTVEEGRYSSASEVVREGLRLVEEREAKISALRREIAAAIEEGGEFTEADIEIALDEAEEEMKKEGY